MKRLLLLFALCGVRLFAQPSPLPQIYYVTGAPVGDCTVAQPLGLQIVITSGDTWFCEGTTVGGLGTWTLLASGGGGGGGVTSVNGVAPVSVNPTTGAVIVTDTSGSGGVPANQPSAGCGVQYTTGLSFTIGACTYSIAGTNYTSPLTNLTLSAADPTNPRIDAIIVDTGAAPTGEAVVLTGTPAATPATPSIDPSTQLALAFVLVNANGTTPANIVTNTIYDENTEWTSTCTAHLTCASTNNPYHGTKDVEATAAVLNNSVTLVDPAAGTVDLASQNTLNFYIRSKAQWPTGTSGSTAARFINVFWKNSSTIKGTVVTLRDGAFGFSSAQTTSYQQISIPASAFGIFGIPVTTLEFQVSGPAGSSSIGFYLDWVQLQSGVSQTPLPTTLMNFRGTWNSTTAYNPNDTVVSSGAGYVALAANTNIAVTTTATWASLSPPTSTSTIASGTSALGTGAITSGACASVVTTTATGVATTDNIMADFNADPTSSTGYSPSTSGMLTIIKYPTSNNVNFKVCNNTGSSITPSAITLNWRVVR